MKRLNLLFVALSVPAMLLADQSNQPKANTVPVRGAQKPSAGMHKPMVSHEKMAVAVQRPETFTPEMSQRLHTMHNLRSRATFEDAARAAKAQAEKQHRALTPKEQMKFFRDAYANEAVNHETYAKQYQGLNQPGLAAHEALQEQGYRIYLSGDKQKIAQYAKENPQFSYIVKPDLTALESLGQTVKKTPR